MDNDEFPPICGTGTEDYFGGAWNFEHPRGEYGVFSAPYSGLPQVIKPDGLYQSQQRFGMYRWHVMDPIRFQEDLRVTIQALGWRSALEEKRRYLPLQDDIASMVFWYQTEPHTAFSVLPDVNYLEVVQGQFLSTSHPIITPSYPNQETLLLPWWRIIERLFHIPDTR